MANQVIVIDRLVAIQRLEQLLSDKKKEQDEWKERQKTYKTRLEKWEKQAVEYIRKNGEFSGDSDDLSPQWDWREEEYSLPFRVDASKLHEALGEKPQNESEPDFFQTQWVKNRQVSPADEVRNALALYKLSTDPTIKVNTSTSWAGFLS